MQSPISGAGENPQNMSEPSTADERVKQDPGKSGNEKRENVERMVERALGEEDHS